MPAATRLPLGFARRRRVAPSQAGGSCRSPVPRREARAAPSPAQPGPRGALPAQQVAGSREDSDIPAQCRAGAGLGAEPRRGESGPGSPSLCQEPGWEGNRGPSRFRLGPYCVGTRRRSGAGRLLLAPRNLAGATSRGRVGGWVCPRDGAVRRWALLPTAMEIKNLFATRCDATTSQGRLCRVCIRVYLYPSLCICSPLPTSPVGRPGLEAARRLVPQGHAGEEGGRDGHTRPPLRSAHKGGWAGEPRCSAASPISLGACELPEALGCLPRCSRASCQSPKPPWVRGGGVCLQRACPCCGLGSPCVSWYFFFFLLCCLSGWLWSAGSILSFG